MLHTLIAASLGYEVTLATTVRLIDTIFLFVFIKLKHGTQNEVDGMHQKIHSGHERALLYFSKYVCVTQTIYLLQ